MLKSFEATGNDVIAEKNDEAVSNNDFYEEDFEKENVPANIIQNPSNSKTPKKAKQNNDNNTMQWKEKYFAALEEMEKLRIENESHQNEMKRYYLFLKATLLEQQLGWDSNIIKEVRAKISQKTPLSEMMVIMKQEDALFVEEYIE